MGYLKKLWARLRLLFTPGAPNPRRRGFQPPKAFSGPITDREVIDAIRAVPCHFVTPVAGNGGGILIGAVTVAAVLTWTRQSKPRVADTTASDTAGWARAQTVVKEYSGTVKFIWDSARTPTAAGITQGAIVTLTLQMGNSGTTAFGPAMLGGPSESVDNQNGIVTYECAWQSTGAWTDP